MKMELFNLLPIICWLLHTFCMSLGGGETCGALEGGNDGNRYRIDLQPNDFLRENTHSTVRWYMDNPEQRRIETNDCFIISDDTTTLYVLVLNASTYGTYYVDCYLPGGRVYKGSNRHNVNNTVLVSTTFGLPSTQSQSTKPDVMSVASSLTTSLAQTTQSSTAGSTIKELLSTTRRVIQTLSPSDALTTTGNFITTKNNGQEKNANDKRTDTTYTTKRQPISSDANSDSIDTSVLNPSAANNGLQNVSIAVVCAASAVIIAIVIAVVCLKRKRRSVANDPLQDTPRVDQVSQKEEGHDVLSVHYEVVPDDNTERGASPMYTSFQTNQQVAETHLYTGLRESSFLSQETSTYYSVAE